MAKLSNRSSRKRRALEGVRSSNTSSAELGIFHNSSQKAASSGETSRVVREERDSRNFILEADAPIVYALCLGEILMIVWLLLDDVYCCAAVTQFQ